MTKQTLFSSCLRTVATRVSIVALAISGIGLGALAHAIPAINLVSPPAIGGVPGTGFVVGYRFLANSDFMVTALGAYDFGRDGIQGGAAVGLYTLAGDLLASAFVPGGTSASFLDGDFRYVDIADVQLNAGTEYVLGAYSDDPKAFFNQNYGGVVLNVDPAITLLRNRDKAIVNQLQFPDREPTGNIHLGSFGPNMQISQAMVVPEPGSLALLLAGLGLMTSMGLRRKD